MSTITPLPANVPNRNQPATFSAYMDVFLAALRVFSTELVPVINEINANAAGASGAAGAAASSAAGALATKALVDAARDLTLQYRDAAANSAAAAASAVNAPTYGGTSTSSVTIGTGLKAFTVEAGKGWVPGMRVTAFHALGQEMAGVVVGYVGTALTINVGRVRGVGTFDTWAIGPSALDFDQVAYVDREALRTYTNASGLVLVDGLGLFLWVQGSTEPDDGETCFAGAGGAWELRLPDVEVALAQWLGELDDVDGRVSDLARSLALAVSRIAAVEARPLPLRATFAQNTLSLASQAAVTSDVPVAGAAVGDDVLVTPPGEIDTTGWTTVRAWVQAAGSVRVVLRNGGGSINSINTGTWSVAVFRK